MESWINEKMGVSKNRGTPKSSHFNRLWNHYFHHPFWGTIIFGNTQVTIFDSKTAGVYFCHGGWYWPLWTQVDPCRLKFPIHPSLHLLRNLEQNDLRKLATFTNLQNPEKFTPNKKTQRWFYLPWSISQPNKNAIHIYIYTCYTIIFLVHHLWQIRSLPEKMEWPKTRLPVDCGLPMSTHSFKRSVKVTSAKRRLPRGPIDGPRGQRANGWGFWCLFFVGWFLFLGDLGRMKGF